MTLAVLLLAQTVTQPVTAAAPSADVVVTAERLRKLRLATSVHDGKLAGCEVKVSSGDGQIDFEACRTMRQCFAQGATASEPLADCVDAGLATYIKERAAAAAARDE